MAILNKKLFLLIILITCTLGLSSCTKNQTLSNPELFIKTYQTEDSIAISFYVNQLNDGGFFVVSTVGNSSLLLSRTNKFGNLLWQKTIIKSGYVQYYQTSTPPWIFNGIATAAGNYIVQSGGTITSFDSSGNIKGNLYNIVINSEMEPQNTNFITSSCDGLLSGTVPSLNTIYEYNSGFKLNKTFSFQDSMLGPGKVLDFFVNPVYASGSYYILGAKYTRSAFTTLDNSKLFAAKIPENGGKAIQTIIDTNDQTHSDQVEWQANALDSNMVILGQRTDVTSSGEFVYPVVIKFDKNLNIIWNKEYSVNNSAIFPRQISTCRDGGYIIVGSIRVAGFGGNNLPYALKIDKDGNKVWDKTITSNAGSGWFVSGTELMDGGYALVGESQQFGKGSTGFTALFVRTDSNGNY